MLDKMPHVRNPLSVIAIFAALAEVSGTAVLPFLPPSLQGIYVWFLMLFPVFLVAGFFLTLNFNQRSLYAPSDYQDERHFVDLVTPASAWEKRMKLDAGVAKQFEARARLGIDGVVVGQPGSGAAMMLPTPHIPNSMASIKVPLKSFRTPQKLKQKIATLTTMALAKVSLDLSQPIQAGVRIGSPYSHLAMIFDGFIENDNRLIGIEVKHFETGYFDRNEIRSYLAAVDALRKELQKSNKHLSLVLVIVTEAGTDIQTKIRNSVNATIGRFELAVDLRIYSSSQLMGASITGTSKSDPAPQ